MIRLARQLAYAEATKIAHLSLTFLTMMDGLTRMYEGDGRR